MNEKDRKKMSDSLKRAHKKGIFGFLKGNQFAKGNPPNKTSFKKGFHPANEFKKGHIPSIATRKKISIAVKNNLPSTTFKKGIHPTTEFKKGQLTGNKHFNWKGGKIKDKNGYILILKPNHPFCDSHNYIREQRLVVEKRIGRYLKPEEVVHHIGIKYPIGSIKNKQDNRPENLIAFSGHSAHLRFHSNPDNVEPKEIIFDGRKLKEV